MDSRSTAPSYGPPLRRPRHPPGDATVIGLAGALVAGVWLGAGRALAVVGIVAVSAVLVVAGRSGRTARLTGRRASRHRALGAAAAVLVVLGGVRGDQAWKDVMRPVPVESFAGPVELVTDPAPVGRGMSVVLEVAGRRFEALAYGSPARRLAQRLAGESLVVAGQLGPPRPARARFLAVRHVVGRIELEHVGAHGPGPPAARAANRVRRALERASVGLPDAERSLFLGLVIGDDREQPRELVERFRRVGLSHLTAVSGQNVAYLLAVAGPILRSLRPMPRWLITISLVAWFALLTRFEPSVLRASGMAGISATAFWRGREAAPVRAIGLTVGGFVLLDPLLVWSVGWWLSIAATLGIALSAEGIAAGVPGPGWFRTSVAVPLAANLGVAPISMAVFGRAPLVSFVVNVLAVPVAGLVMMAGIPCGLLAAAVPGLGPLALLPCRIGTRWILVVAQLGDVLEPDRLGAWGGVAQIAVAVALWRRRRRSGGIRPVP